MDINNYLEVRIDVGKSMAGPSIPNGTILGSMVPVFDFCSRPSMTKKQKGNDQQL